MKEMSKTHDIYVGVVGLGLMGSSIVAALLASGHPVKAIVPLKTDTRSIYDQIKAQLLLCRGAGVIDTGLDTCLNSLTISYDYAELKPCTLVMECVVENAGIKKEVYQKIMAAVSRETIIGTNTSAIPISQLQDYIDNPCQFLGIHWSEPAFMTKFLEITCGYMTDRKYADRIFNLAHYWGKEPTLLKKDIRGFITNRLMYAVYREIFSQMEKGTATREDFDKAFRYDAGSWMTLMGIFRRMDYLGLEDFKIALTNIFPKLCNSPEVPVVMQDIVKRGARGVHNGIGLYPYTKNEGQLWDLAFARFNLDIHKIAATYSADKIAAKLKE